MISNDNTYAIVGASSSHEKYGYKVLKDLKEAGYNVVPINPKGGEILGLEVFTSLEEYLESDSQNEIDVVVFIVPPKVTESVLKQVKELGIDRVWMQPGSESEEAIQFCEDNGIDCVHNSCIMVQRPH